MFAAEFCFFARPAIQLDGYWPIGPNSQSLQSANATAARLSLYCFCCSSACDGPIMMFSARPSTLVLETRYKNLPKLPSICHSLSEALNASQQYSLEVWREDVSLCRHSLHTYRAVSTPFPRILELSVSGWGQLPPSHDAEMAVRSAPLRPPTIQRSDINSRSIKNKSSLGEQDAPYPTHFICRDNGDVVPVIALDDLPPSVRVSGVPRTFRGLHDTAGMVNLGVAPRKGGFYVVDIVHTDRNIPHPSSSPLTPLNPYRAPDALIADGQRQNGGSRTKQARCSIAEPSDTQVILFRQYGP